MDYTEVRALRDNGLTWPEIAKSLGYASHDALRKSYGRWAKRQEDSVEPTGVVVQKWVKTEDGTVHVRMPVEEITEDFAREVWEEMREDFAAWRPSKKPPPVHKPNTKDPALAVVCIMDPHLGMRSWDEETGQPSQDLDTMTDDYSRVAKQLVALSRVYPV